MLPRAQFDVSALYYQKSLYADEAKKAAYKEKYGNDLAPPDTWEEVTKQAEFFAAPPDFYGTQFAGKEEAINGRFYEMLVAEGGEYLDKDGKPAFNSEAGVRALDWFVNLYKAKAVPAGTTNYLWDDLGQGFASGTIALNLDWPGWAGFFNDPEVVEGRRQCRREGAAEGLVRQAHRLVRSPRLLGHRELRQQGGRRLAGLVPDQRGQPEARGRRRPAADPHRRLGLGHRAGQGRPLQGRGADGLPGSGHRTPSRCRRPPQWIEISNAVYPELQAAILGDKTSKQALDEAAAKATEILQDAGEL